MAKQDQMGNAPEGERQVERSEKLKQNMNKVLDFFARRGGRHSQNLIYKGTSGVGRGKMKETLLALAADGKIQNFGTEKNGSWGLVETALVLDTKKDPAEVPEIIAAKDPDVFLDSVVGNLNDDLSNMDVHELRRKYLTGDANLRKTAAVVREAIGQEVRISELEGFSDKDLAFIVEELEDFAAQVEEIQREHDEVIAREQAEREAASAAVQESGESTEVTDINDYANNLFARVNRALESHDSKVIHGDLLEKDDQSLFAIAIRAEAGEGEFSGLDENGRKYIAEYAESLIKNVQGRLADIDRAREKHENAQSEPAVEEVEQVVEQVMEAPKEDVETVEESPRAKELAITYEETLQSFEDNFDLYDLKEEISHVESALQDPDTRGVYATENESQREGLRAYLKQLETLRDEHVPETAPENSLEVYEQNQKEFLNGLLEEYRDADPDRKREIHSQFIDVKRDLEQGKVQLSEGKKAIKLRLTEQGLEQMSESEPKIDLVDLNASPEVTLEAGRKEKLNTAVDGILALLDLDVGEEKHKKYVDMVLATISQLKEQLAEGDVKSPYQSLEEMQYVLDRYEDAMDSPERIEIEDVPEGEQAEALSEVEGQEEKSLADQLVAQTVALGVAAKVLATIGTGAEREAALARFDAVKARVEELESLIAGVEDLAEFEEDEDTEIVPRLEAESEAEKSALDVWKEEREVGIRKYVRSFEDASEERLQKELTATLEERDQLQAQVDEGNFPSDDAKEKAVFRLSMMAYQLRSLNKMIADREGTSDLLEKSFMNEGDRSSAAWDRLNKMMETEGEKVEEEFEEATRRAQLWNYIKSTRIWKREMEGQVLPEELEDKEISTTGRVVAAAGGLALGGISSVSSYLGYKIAADLPRWMAQEYYTSFERADLKALIDQEPGRLKSRVESSKYLNLEKRAKFLATLDRINERFEKDLESALTDEEKTEIEAAKEKATANILDIQTKFDQAERESEEKRNQEIARLIDQMIETRVESKTVIKESLNTAMALTGYNHFRAAGYGAVAIWQRGSRVMNERGLKELSGEQNESFVNDFVMEGLRDMQKNLAGREGEGKITRGINIAKASGNILRAAGIAYGVDKYIGPGQFSGSIDWALEKLSRSEVGMFASNITAASPEVAIAGKEVRAEALEQMAATSESAVGSVAESAVAGSVEAPRSDLIERLQAGADSGGADVADIKEAAIETAKEASADYAISAKELKLGEVRQGDGFVAIFKRQLEADPDKFGYEGDPNNSGAVEKWATTNAIDIAKNEGIINGQFEQHLTTASIGELSAVVNADGSVDFLDAKTGSEITNPSELKLFTTSVTNGVVEPSWVESQAAPPKQLAEEALQGAEMALNRNVVAPGIELMTTADGREALYDLEHADVRFQYNDNHEVVSVQISSPSPPRELRDKVLASFGDSNMMPLDKENYASQIATQVYVLSELERAGMGGSNEYNDLLGALQQLMKHKSGDMSVDLTAGVYGDMMHGVEVPDTSPLSEVNDAVAEEQTDPKEKSPYRTRRGREILEKPPRRSRVIMSLEDANRVRENVELTEFTDGQGTFQIGPYGAVKFEYDGEGNVTGMDQQMEFGAWARLEAMGNVQPGTGPIYDESDITRTQEVVTTRNGRTFNGRTFTEVDRDLPRNQLQAKRDAALKILAFEKIDEELADHGYRAFSSERQYIKQAEAQYRRAFNEQWKGRLRIP